MANSNIASIGRFSSQMLTYLGTQRVVKSVTGQSANTFKYSTGTTVFPDPGSVSQAALGGGVVGNFSPTTYDNTRSFFLSRNASVVYAESMTALTIDIASVLGVSPQSLLEQSEFLGALSFSDNAYRVFNEFRDPGNQVGTVTSINNRDSLQARSIRG